VDDAGSRSERKSASKGKHEAMAKRVSVKLSKAVVEQKSAVNEKNKPKDVFLRECAASGVMLLSARFCNDCVNHHELQMTERCFITLVWKSFTNVNILGTEGHGWR